MYKDKVLTRQQMNHLADLGINIRKASIAVIRAIINPTDDCIPSDASEEYVLGLTSDDMRFMLQDLIDLMPSSLKGNYNNEVCYLRVDFDDNYMYYEYCIDGERYNYTFTCSDTLLNSAYDMVCWLVERKYILI